MMSKNHLEAALRARLDPYALLPEVQLLPGMCEGLTPISIYRIRTGIWEVGSLMLSRTHPMVGVSTSRIDEVSLDVPLAEKPDFHQSAALAALAISWSEGHTMVSDNRNTIEETGIWCWWRDGEVAEVVEPFTISSELDPYQPIFEGRAVAKPITLIN